MQLLNKKILITGATSGIGLQLVDQLHHNNSVYIIARNQNKINELTKKYPSITAFKADFKNITEVIDVANSVACSIQTLDVLINNAALQKTPTFIDDDFSLPDTLDEITVNFTAVVSLTHLLLPRLMGQHNAAILNVNSGLAIMPKTSSAVYCATKAALDSLSKSLGYQLEATNVDVLQAFLPLVDTAMTTGRGQGKLSADIVASKLIEGIEKGIVAHDIGKVKLLRCLNRIVPSVAKSIMKKS